MVKAVLKKQTEKRIRNGYPLVHPEDLKQAAETEEWVDFTAENGRFIAKGYLGKQNKGAGWILSRADVPIDQAFFVRLFSEAKLKRQALFQDDLTSAFRIFNGEGDGLGGLTADWYDHFAVLSWYNETIYGHRKMITEAFKQVFPEIKGASEKIRFACDLPETSWAFGTEPETPLIVKENGVSYAVYLNDGLMTGIFLDQKHVRDQLVQGFAAGASVLNMFSYTGAFSVAAAMGGALETASVDLAKRSRSRTQEQFAVNGLSLDQNKIVVMDVFEYFKYAERKGLKYDLIILDPPSFARNKKKTFAVSRNYGELISDSLKILKQEGRIIASTNAANLSVQKFQDIVEKELANSGATFKQEQCLRLPADFSVLPDFEEGNYLKVLIYHVKR